MTTSISGTPRSLKMPDIRQLTPERPSNGIATYYDDDFESLRFHCKKEKYYRLGMLGKPVQGTPATANEGTQSGKHPIQSRYACLNYDKLQRSLAQPASTGSYFAENDQMLSAYEITQDLLGRQAASRQIIEEKMQPARSSYFSRREELQNRISKQVEEMCNEQTTQNIAGRLGQEHRDAVSKRIRELEECVGALTAEMGTDDPQKAISLCRLRQQKLRAYRTETGGIRDQLAGLRQQLVDALTNFHRQYDCLISILCNASLSE